MQAPVRRGGTQVLFILVPVASAFGTPTALAAEMRARATSSAPSSVDDWNHFYATHVEAAYRFLGAFLAITVVLYVLSGLTSRFFVPADAVEWNTKPLAITRFLGGFLIVATAGFLPTYTMYEPFSPSDVVHIYAPYVLAVLFVVIIALFVWAQGSKEDPAGWLKSLLKMTGTWRRFAITLFALGVASLVLWFEGPDGPYQRMLITYIALAACGVMTTASSFGQNCRIQLDAQTANSNGKHDTAATEYLLARLQTFGLEQRRDVGVILPSEALGALNSSELSATPAGQILGTLARVAYALRPSLTWRALVTIVDDERLTMTLFRNGCLINTTIFSRRDLGLRAVDPADRPSVDRARAQLLSGAAAFVLHELAKIYPRHQKGQYGATMWQSIVLQNIASSQSLSETEDRHELARQATNLDPENLEARFTYISLLREQNLEHSAARALTKRLDGLRDHLLESTSEDSGVKPGLEGLALRVLYFSVCGWLTIAVREQSADKREGDLKYAEASLDLLKRHAESASAVAQAEPKMASAVRLQLANLSSITSTLTGKAIDPPEVDSTGSLASPRLAFNDACYEALLVAKLKKDREPPSWESALDKLVEDLAFAAGTDKSKQSARTDPFFTSVYREKRFLDVLRPAAQLPRCFLDLKPFADYAGPLSKAGLDTPTRFADANRTPWQRWETATYLQAHPATIDRMYQIAEIGEFDRRLAEPCLLHLLLELGIRSLEDLRQRIREDKDALEGELTDAAALCGVEWLPSVAKPTEWIEVVEPGP